MNKNNNKKHKIINSKILSNNIMNKLLIENCKQIKNNHLNKKFT